MKTFRLFAAFFFAATVAFAADVQQISPAEAAKRVATGKAVLVDVREPAEWAETGVAYRRFRADLEASGLYVRLDGGGGHLFTVRAVGPHQSDLG